MLYFEMLPKMTNTGNCFLLHRTIFTALLV